MLTSSNQYLRPEYLTPLPTTLDAKKSPLALLAQTCSQIGADAPNSKLISNSAGGGDKKTTKESSAKDNNKSNGKSSDSPPHKMTNFKPYDLNNSSSSSREKSKSPEERSSSASTGSRVRTPISKSSASNARCNSNQSATSQRESPVIERKTPANNESLANGGGDERTTPSSNSGRMERRSPHTPTSSRPPTSTSSLTSVADIAKDSHLATAFRAGTIPVSSAYLGGYPPGLPPPLGMDLMTSSLMSQHHALKAGALSPYLNYARLKSPSDPLCRDPYCTGCSLSSHLMPPSAPKTPTSCPAGCTQCDHVINATSKAPSYLTHNPAAAAYAHAQLAALAAASHLPYVCNWISGDAAYCGKRFSSSEELLTHLRTHTSVSSVVSEASALSMLSASGLPPTHPLLHRTYPTPPLSPLAAARYHPYSKPSLLPPSLTMTTSPLSGYPLTHPGLPPYLSPYSIYGPRLGAAPGMHP